MARPTMRLHVRVAQRDIERGEPRSACYCPLAYAIRRAARAAGMEITSDLLVTCWASYAEIRPVHGHDWVASWPQAVGRFMRAFDAAGMRVVSPIDFDLILEAA